jgi:hypothetical protein
MRGLGVPFVDFNDEATLSGGDLDSREDLALLLLERRPVLIYGNLSFMREDLGVSSEGCDAEDA